MAIGVIPKLQCMTPSVGIRQRLTVLVKELFDSDLLRVEDQRPHVVIVALGWVVARPGTEEILRLVHK